MGLKIFSRVIGFPIEKMKTKLELINLHFGSGISSISDVTVTISSRPGHQNLFRESWIQHLFVTSK